MKSKVHFFFLAAIVSILQLNTTNASAQGNTPQSISVSALFLTANPGGAIMFTGNVKDAFNAPVANSIVGVEDPFVQMSLGNIATTDAFGNFSYTAYSVVGSEPGIYTFVFYASSYVYTSFNVGLNDNSSSVNTLFLNNIEIKYGSLGNNPSPYDLYYTKKVTNSILPQLTAAELNSLGIEIMSETGVAGKSWVKDAMNSIGKNPYFYVGIAMTVGCFVPAVQAFTCAPGIKLLGGTVTKAFVQQGSFAIIEELPIGTVEKEQMKLAVSTTMFVSSIYTFSPQYGTLGNTVLLGNLVHSGHQTIKDAQGNYQRIILAGTSSDGTTQTMTLWFEDDIVPPTVLISAPTNNATIAATTQIIVNATDSESGIMKVDFLIDNQFLSTDTISPYSISWNTTTVTNGLHTITAKAYDNAGNVSSTSIGVNVQNTVTQLYNGFVNPASGNTNTSFSFKVTYKDPANYAPSNVKLVIGTTSYTMTNQATNFSSGVEFTKLHTFTSAASYTYHFEATTNSGTLLRLPSSGEYQMNVSQSATGWDIVATQISTDVASVQPNGSFFATGKAWNSQSAGTYSNVPYSFTLLFNGNIIDQKNGSITSLSTGAIITINSPEMNAGSTEGVYQLVFSLFPTIDNNPANNTISTSVFVGTNITTDQFYISNSDKGKYLSATSNYPYPFNGHDYKLYGAFSNYASIQVDNNQIYSIYKMGVEWFNNDIDVLVLEGTFTSTEPAASVSFGSSSSSGSSSYVNFTNSTITCYPGDTAIFIGQCTSKTFKNQAPKFYNGQPPSIVETIWFLNKVFYDSYHEINIKFKIPTSTSPTNKTFYFGLEFTDGSYQLCRLKIKVIAKPPMISSLNKNIISVDDTITISGSGLLTTGTVKLNNVSVPSANILSWTTTLIKIKVPTGVTTGFLTVTNSNGTSNALAYNVLSTTGNPEVITIMPNQMMYAGDTLIVCQLANIFSDPNNQHLSYSCSITNTGLSYRITELNQGNLILIADSAAEGTYEVTITATDPTNKSISTSFNVTVISLQQIIIINPTNGITYSGHDTLEIIWASIAISKLNIQYSFDSIIWHVIATNVPTSQSNFSWPIPDTNASNCFIRIIDASDNNPTASFGPFIIQTVPRYTLTLKAQGPGNIKLNNNIIALPHTFQADSGSYYVIEAIPLGCSQFYDWSIPFLIPAVVLPWPEGWSIPNPTFYRLTSTDTVTAYFTDSCALMLVDTSIDPYTNGPEMVFQNGSVFANGNSVTAGTVFNCGDTIVLTAIPDSGYQFSGWIGSPNPLKNPDTVILCGENHIRRFSFIPYLPPSPFTCGDTLTDTRDSQKYPTVQIGSQCWMAKNLNVGVMANSVNTGTVHSDVTNNMIYEKYCYNNDISKCNIYGGLYDWSEMMDYIYTPGTQGICPTGWHIPTDAEWCTLTLYLDTLVNCNILGWSGSNAGSSIKENGTTHWASPNNGATNNSGFTALGSGNRDGYGNFYLLNYSAYFWTSQDYSSSTALGWNLTYSEPRIRRQDHFKSGAFSVRCIWDSIPTCSPQPDQADAGPDSINIPGSSIVLQANQPVNGAGLWTILSGTGGILSDPSLHSTLFQGQAGSTYALTWTISNACGSNSDTVMISFSSSQVFTCGDTLTDTRDSQKYPTVQIGSQCWMAKNLNVGVMVNSANTGTFHSDVTNNLIIEKYCYNNDPGNCSIYGGLYDWNEMMNYTSTPACQGICPTGWHVPTDAEWFTLTNYLGGVSLAGGKMKETGDDHWLAPNTGAINSSGFTAVGAGRRYDYGNFGNLRYYASFWSSTDTPTGPLSWRLYYGVADLFRDVYESKIRGFSVRCLSDSQLPCTPQPDQADAGPDSLHIPGSSLVLQAIQPVNGTGLWTILSGTGGILSDPSLYNTVFQGQSGSIYTLVWTISNPCGSTSDTVFIEFAVQAQISGSLRYRNSASSALQAVPIYLHNAAGNVVDSTNSSTAGTYLFQNILDGAYTLRPHVTKPWGGVTAMDLTRYRQVIANIDTIAPMSPFHKKAGDVNKSNHLSITDLIWMRNRISFNVDTFPAGDWLYDSTEVVVQGANISRNIYALCFGDGNGSFTPAAKSSFPELLQSSSQIMTVTDPNYITLPLIVNKGTDVASITMNIAYREDLLEFISAEVPQFNNELSFNESNGIIRLVFSSLQTLGIQQGASLAFLHFKSRSAVPCNPFAPITSIGAEFGNLMNEEIHGTLIAVPMLICGLTTGTASLLETSPTLNVYPNPFSNQLNIEFTLHAAGYTKLELYDHSGRRVRVLVEGQWKAGNHNYVLENDGLSEGLYFLKMFFRNDQKPNLIVRKITLIR